MLLLVLRLVLRLKLERDGNPLAAVLRFAPTPPLNLRWGAVVAATHELLATKLALAASMGTALFPTGLPKSTSLATCLAVARATSW